MTHAKTARSPEVPWEQRDLRPRGQIQAALVALALAACVSGFVRMLLLRQLL